MNEDNWVVEVPQPGGPEALMRVKRPVPEPGHGEILIEVHAAGVNRGDIKQREGDFPKLPSSASAVLGLEVSGTVAACGAGVAGWAVGDRVCALLVGGGYAEYCVAPAVQCMQVPPGFDHVQAAAIPETFATVWLAMFVQAALQPGESVLVHGGSSGIGVAAVQLAHASGATVYVTAGTDDKCAFCKGLGAAEAINYRHGDFAPKVMELTGGKGVDVVVDMVGAPYAAQNLAVLAPRGRLAYVAGDGGGSPCFNIREIMIRRLVITGVTLRHRTIAEKDAVLRELEHKVWPWLASGVVRPVVARVFPFAEVADAHRFLESGAATGKVILQMR